MRHPEHRLDALAGARFRSRAVDVGEIVERDHAIEREAAGHDMIHVDPIALESKIVVDATGHDAVVVELLHKRNLYKAVPGNGAMWVSRSEEEVMDRTGEVYPNCFVIGLAVAAVYGTPRMGPAFGSMLLSGRYGAELIKKKLKQE